MIAVSSASILALEILMQDGKMMNPCVLTLSFLNGSTPFLKLVNRYSASAEIDILHAFVAHYIPSANGRVSNE